VHTLLTGYKVAGSKTDTNALTQKMHPNDIWQLTVELWIDTETLSLEVDRRWGRVEAKLALLLPLCLRRQLIMRTCFWQEGGGLGCVAKLAQVWKIVFVLSGVSHTYS